MTENTQAIATSWPDLIRHLTSIPKSHAQNFAQYFGVFAAMEVSDPRLGPPFFGAISSLTRGTIMGQGPHMARPMRGLGQRADAIARSDDPDLAHLPVANLAALAVHALQNGAAWGASDIPVDAMLDRLEQEPPLADDTARQSAWALLAYGRAAAMPQLLLNDPASAPPDPNTIFGASIKNMQTHLAKCIVHGSAPSVAAPAWEKYLSSFPSNLAAEQATWPELIWAARAVHVYIHGGAEDQTLDWLLSQLR